MVASAAIPGQALEPADATLAGGYPATIPRGWWSLIIGAGVAAAWLITIAGSAMGAGTSLHHHALIEAGPPLWIALPLFLAAWLVMVAAMMLPASLPAMDAFARTVTRSAAPHPMLAWARYLGAYLAVWLAFGLGAFIGDIVLHRVVDATPALAGNTWLIDAVLLAGAGTYQFTPWKRRNLTACRHPMAAVDGAPGRDASAGHRGLAHGLDCLGSSWALMLLMFAAGVANLWWMVALTILMAYEATGRRGRTVASIAGAALIVAALLVVSTGSVLV
jgi:predicted metal-binding membrane protein